MSAAVTHLTDILKYDLDVEREEWRGRKGEEARKRKMSKRIVN
jgi:hypothetical protein